MKIRNLKNKLILVLMVVFSMNTCVFADETKSVLFENYIKNINEDQPSEEEILAKDFEQIALEEKVVEDSDNKTETQNSLQNQNHEEVMKKFLEALEGYIKRHYYAKDQYDEIVSYVKSIENDDAYINDITSLLEIDLPHYYSKKHVVEDMKKKESVREMVKAKSVMEANGYNNKEINYVLKYIYTEGSSDYYKNYYKIPQSFYDLVENGNLKKFLDIKELPSVEEKELTSEFFDKLNKIMNSLSNTKVHLYYLCEQTYKFENTLPKIVETVNAMDKMNFSKEFQNSVIKNFEWQKYWDNGKDFENDFFAEEIKFYEDLSFKSPTIANVFKEKQILKIDFNEEALQWLDSKENIEDLSNIIDTISHKSHIVNVLNKNNIKPDKKISAIKSIKRYNNYSKKKFLITENEAKSYCMISCYGGVTAFIVPPIMLGYIITSRLNREIKKPILYGKGMINAKKAGVKIEHPANPEIFF